MKVTFVATVFNEEKTIQALLESIAAQSRMPDEVIIVDGGSTDKTIEIMQSEKRKAKNNNLKLKIITKPGNRAVGRNEGIRKATGDVIVSSDAGCVLDKDWVRKIIEPFEKGDVDPDLIGVDVVAGYYKGKPQNIFQKCLVPYVLVMPDRVDPNNFLPASRTMAFTKKILEKAGGFPEKYSHNEDYVFAKKLKNIGAHIVFARDAIVYWMPRKNLKEAFIMFFRFAYGDAQAWIFRPKVLLIFLRYFLGALFLLSYFNTVYLIVAAYAGWSIAKNYRYVNHWQAVILLPVIQITADIAVILGTIWGIQNKR